jgi:hypothetical protein
MECEECGTHLRILPGGSRCGVCGTEYDLVKGTIRRWYLRRRRYDNDNPSEAQRKAREALASVATSQGRNRMGTVTIKKGDVEKEVPASALPIMQLKGKRFTTRHAPVPAPQGPVAALESFVKVLEFLASLSSS